MDDLITWLRDQIDDDERAARTAACGPWRQGTGGGGYVLGGPNGQFVIAAQSQAWNAGHIARHDPARVLAEVDAKRRRLDEIESMLRDDPTDETARYLAQIDALPYADRDGYREEWRP